MIMSALVFKMNGQGYGYEFDGPHIIYVCTAAFIGHCVVHCLLLAFVVPMFRRADRDIDEEANVTYAETAQRLPVSWFSGNPIHCLRSKMVYKHDPPCDFFVLGKEHLLRINKDIGCYFHSGKAESEEFEAANLATMITKKVSEDYHRLENNIKHQQDSARA